MPLAGAVSNRPAPCAAARATGRNALAVHRPCFMWGAHTKLLMGAVWLLSSCRATAGTCAAANENVMRRRVSATAQPAARPGVPERRRTRTSRTMSRLLSSANVASRLGSNLFQATRTSGLLSGDSYRIVECSRLLRPHGHSGRRRSRHNYSQAAARVSRPHPGAPTAGQSCVGSRRHRPMQRRPRPWQRPRQTPRGRAQ